MRRFPRPLRACEAVLLGTLASNAARADNGPTVITGVFCDTEAQIASFAEAHLGAQLSVLEATRAINKAAGKDACSPIANVIVGSREEVKQMKLGGTYNTRIITIIARHVPSQAAAADLLFSLGEARLRALFAAAGFQNVEMTTESHRFSVPSFDEYFDHVERGWGSSGLLYVALPENTKNAVREDVRRHVGDNGGPLEIEVEFRFAIGQK